MIYCDVEDCILNNEGHCDSDTPMWKICFSGLFET